MIFKNIINKRIGTYPCNDYLNNALRILLQDEPSAISFWAIQEIICCIQSAGGYFFEDVEQSLKEHGYFKY